MATSDEILEVRNNTNTTTADYSDTVVGGLIDDSSVECASATIWKWEMAKVPANYGLESASTGTEAHKFPTLDKAMDYYQKMYDFYKKECEDSKGAGSPALIKARPKSVAGIITKEDIIEYDRTGTVSS